MKKVIFDYTLSLSEIQISNELINQKELSIDELKSIANGNIYIFFEPQRNYISLETGIIDYLIQLKNVIKEIKLGNNTPFSVSCDWFSNSLSFEYEPPTNILTIREVNDNKFKIKTRLNIFEISFIKFEQRVLRDFEFLFPKLNLNQNFINLKN